MGTFSAIPKPKLPPRTVELALICWAPDYEQIPDCAVHIGLRLVSEFDIESARSDAAKKAIEMHPREADQDRIDCFNDLVISNIVARATCQPDDVTVGYFEMPEMQLRQAFTTDAIKMLWDELQNMQIELSVLSPEATDDELMELMGLLMSDDAWAALQPAKAKRLRRQCHDLLVNLDPELRV